MGLSLDFLANPISLISFIIIIIIIYFIQATWPIEKKNNTQTETAQKHTQKENKET